MADQSTSRLVAGFLTMVALTITGSTFAQQTPQYSLYMLNRYQFNPAYAGMDASLSINAAYRAQWVDVPGNPVQQNVNAHMPFYLLNGALGMSIDHDKIGAENTLKGMVSYNYVIDAPLGLFSLGLGAGFRQKTLDGTALKAPGGDYEGSIIIHNDADIPATKINGFAPEVAVGIYYAGDYFDAGLAITDFTIGDIELEGAVYKSQPAINFIAEYFIENLDRIKFYPSVLVRTDFVQTQMEVSVLSEYDDFLSFGLGIRGYSGNTIDAAVVMAGFKISEHLTFAYAFDITLSALNRSTSGSHEVVLNYNLNKIIGAGLPPPAIYSPRFY